MATYTNYYSLKKPGDEDTADIVDLNNNADTIDSTMHSISQDADKALDSIAGDYNSSTTYYSRSLVWHYGELYICTASSTTGDWDSTAWSRATVSGGLTGVQGELTGRCNALQDNISNMWPLIYKTAAMIADNYSSSKSYTVGDYVMYSFELYKCISNTTGDWDETAWEHTTIIDIIKGLNI